MSNIASKFLEAMGIVADKAVSGVAADETIYAQIVSIDTEQTNTYKLAYENAFIEAVGLGDYKVGDIVSVKIPNGDFEQRKTIIEKWTGITTKQDFIAYEDEYKDRADLGVSVTSLEIEGDNTVALSFVNEASALSTINHYRAFQLSGLFDYRFAPEVDGVLQFSDALLDLDYGVELICKDKEGNEHTYTLSINDFAGNPYSSYGSNISQTRLFALADGIELAEITTFRAFVKGSSLLEEDKSSYFNMTNFTVTAMGNLPVVQDVGTYVLNLSRISDTVLVDNEKEVIDETLAVETEIYVLRGATRISVNSSNLTCSCASVTENASEYYSLTFNDGVGLFKLKQYPIDWEDVTYFTFSFTYNDEVVGKATLSVTRLQHGSSPYQIVLSNDYDTVPGKSDGTVTDEALSGATTEVTVYYGDQQITSALKQEEGIEDKAYLEIISAEGLVLDTDYQIKWNEAENKAIITLLQWKDKNVSSYTFKCYYRVDNKVATSKNFVIKKINIGLVDFALYCAPLVWNKTGKSGSLDIAIRAYKYESYDKDLIASLKTDAIPANKFDCRIQYRLDGAEWQIYAPVASSVDDFKLTLADTQWKTAKELEIKLEIGYPISEIDSTLEWLLWDTETINFIEDNSELYTLAIDNDADVLVRRNTDKSIIGDLPIVTAKMLKASEDVTESEKSNLIVEIDSNVITGDISEIDWAQLQDANLSFTSIPETLTWAQFIFKWIKEEKVLSQQTFSLKIISADYDYDLDIAQTIINHTQSGGTIAVQVWKKGDAEPEHLTASDGYIRLYNGETEITDWANAATYNQYSSTFTQDNITFTLKGKVGGNENFIWDTEVVEFVHDGQGIQGNSLEVRYINSETFPTIVDNDVSQWSPKVPAPETNKLTYMTQKISNEVNWSTPIQLSGNDGKTPTITINKETGYWEVNGESTGVKAEGEDGATPTVKITEDGYWEINGNITDVKAQGEAGKDGDSVEYVYCLSESQIGLEPPQYNDNGDLTVKWTPSPSGISKDVPYEYVSVRTKIDGVWGAFSNPVIWSKWGEQGQDGDGVYYEYYNTDESDVSQLPDYETSPEEWSDNPIGVSEDFPYEYVIQIRTTTDGKIISKPALWAKWSKDGEPGLEGQQGPSGWNNTTILLYKRSSSALSTTGIGTTTYNFTNGSITGSLNGWSKEIPPGSSPCYVIQTSVNSQESTVTIASNAWSNPRVFVVNGQDGKVDYDEVDQYIEETVKPLYDTEGLTYDPVSGEYYINVTTAIAKEALLVGSLTNPILLAGTVDDQQVVKIGGWTASELALYSNSGKTDENGNFIPYSYLSSGGGLPASDIGGTSQSNLVFKVGDNFGVDTNGTLYASNAQISGILTAGAGSQIGGWVAESTMLRSASWEDEVDAIPDIFFSTVGHPFDFTIGPYTVWEAAMKIGNKFAVQGDGTLYASGARISGELQAMGGSIAKWSILGSELYSTTKRDGTQSDPNMIFSLDSAAIGTDDYCMRVSTYYTEDAEDIYLTDYFTLTGNGILTAIDANITGTLIAGTGSQIGQIAITEEENKTILSCVDQYGTGFMLVTDPSATTNAYLMLGDAQSYCTTINNWGINIDNITRYADISKDLSKRRLPLSFYMSTSDTSTENVYLYLTRDGTVKWAIGDDIPLEELAGAAAPIWDGSYTNL